jgi:hypothetical protein
MIQVHTESGIGIITIANYEQYQSDETPGQSRGSDAPRNGAVREPPTEAVANFTNDCAATVFETDQADSGAVTGAVNGAVMVQGLAENRGKTNKQIKESKTPSPKRVTDHEIGLAFDEWWKAYPRKVEKGGAKKKYTSIVKLGQATIAEMLDGAKAYRDAKAGTEARFIKHPTTWLNNGCWADERNPAAAPQSNGANVDAFWRERIPKFQKDGAWSTGALGPRPGESGCRVPAHILEEFKIRPP